ncbi:hypothetical protein AAFF27_08835 [Xylophilus sp. GW821-FHT01B05]
MKKSVIAALISVAMLVPTAGFAQFGNVLGSVKSLAGSSSGGASTDLTGQQDQLVRNYVAAGKDVLSANTYMAEALGIKNLSVNAAATSDSMSASDIEGQDKAISANAQAIAEATKAGATLKDSEAKAKYAQGLAALVLGAKKYVGMRGDVQNFSSGLSSASLLQLPKLQSGVYVVKSLPTSAANLTDSLKSAIDFARHNGVEVPSDATSLL